VLVVAFILLEFRSPSTRIFIGSHSLPPSLVRRISPSLFRAELHTLPTSEPRTCRAARASGLLLAVRGSRREEYIPCTMTTNNAD
jgi:hypothetical protein